MAITIILNLIVALIVFAFMFRQQSRHATFTVRVFTGLGLAYCWRGRASHLWRRCGGHCRHQ